VFPDLRDESASSIALLDGSIPVRPISLMTVIASLRVIRVMEPVIDRFNKTIEVKCSMSACSKPLRKCAR
jgi:hypothetical protein